MMEECWNETLTKKLAALREQLKESQEMYSNVHSELELRCSQILVLNNKLADKQGQLDRLYEATDKLTSDTRERNINLRDENKKLKAELDKFKEIGELNYWQRLLDENKKLQADYILKNDQYTHLANKYDKLKAEVDELKDRYSMSTDLRLMCEDQKIKMRDDYKELGKLLFGRIKERGQLIVEARTMLSKQVDMIGCREWLESTKDIK